MKITLCLFVLSLSCQSVPSRITMADLPPNAPNQEAVAMLQRGDVLRFNAQKRSHPEWLNLANADLRERNLQKAQLDGADLRGANLGGADLTNASLAGAKIDGTILRGATLRGAVLSETILAQPKFEKIDFRGARMWRVKWSQPSFVECDLRDAALIESQVDGLYAERSQLDKIDLSKSSLVGARIVDCRMSFVGGLGATLDGAQIAPRPPYTVNFSRASAKKVVFAKSTWAAPLFLEGVFDGAVFTEAQMDSADFDGASLEGANFSGAVFTESSFRKIRAVGANFTGATFDHCVFKNADLRRARFDNARFRKKILFEGAILDGASFAGSDSSQATTDLPGGFPR